METGLPWHVVEEAINREIKWLERVIEQAVIGKVLGCDNWRYTFRKIALLIITDRITAKELIHRNGHNLCNGLTKLEEGFPRFTFRIELRDTGKN